MVTGLHVALFDNPKPNFFHTLGVGLLDFELNSSPRPAYSSLIGVPNVSQERPSPEYPLECPVSLPREGGDVRSKISVVLTTV